MQNVNVTVKGSIATIVIDLSKDFGKSASGKSTIVASTHGNVQMGDTGVTLGLNAYRKAA